MSMNEENLTAIPGIYLTYKQMNVLITFQKLWSQLAMWMRNFILSDFADSRNLEAVTTQLFQDLPLNYYNTFINYYGTEISQVLLEHISRFLASGFQLINAYKNNDSPTIDSSISQWYQSADDLASFLASVNIYWSKDQWSNLLNQYIKLIIQEVNAAKGREFGNEINIYNNVEELTDLMGSYMARGIIAKVIGIKSSMLAKHFMPHY